MRRNQAVRDWRGGIPEADSIRDRIDPLSALLQRELKFLGLEKRFAEEEIAAEWGALVSAFIAQHSRPDSLKNGVLYVQVLQPALRDTLERDMKKTLLKRFQDRFGADKVRDIRFRF
ncbi:MAG: DUF721 domain-containing protein [Verrucomicrobiales bacterium]